MTKTVAQALQQGIEVLRPVIGDSASRDARLLLAYALGIESGRLTLVLPDVIQRETNQRFDELVEARKNRQPVSQIIGRRQFWGQWFRVTPDVLDPRPETESLIAAALECDPPDRILDLGTGSGCILITLLTEFSGATGIGSDLSVAALKVADQNANNLGVADRAELIQSDWFARVTGTFDLIVSNPPYITGAEMRDLDPEVSNWEPMLALTPGEDGLDAYRKIAVQIRDFMNSGATGLFEIGKTQGTDVTGIFRTAGFSDVSIIQDMNGHDRIIRVKA